MSGEKMKKAGQNDLSIRLRENPDILSTLARYPAQRPRLVVGFAAETENLLDSAREKWQRKGCDWIVANDVSKPVFGEDSNHVFLLTGAGTEEWRASKTEIAERLADRIADFFSATVRAFQR
jgi:phosphopantothenoylcysteine decarboxylase/phosphopantothenate--cysteine ligase